MFDATPGIHGDRPAPTDLPCVHVALARVLATGLPERAEYTTALGGFAGGVDGEVELRASVTHCAPSGSPWPPRRVVKLFGTDGRDLARSVYDEYIPVTSEEHARVLLADIRACATEWVACWGRNAFESAVAPELRHLWGAK
jgi:hypothetical protein